MPIDILRYKQNKWETWVGQEVRIQLSSSKTIMFCVYTFGRIQLIQANVLIKSYNNGVFDWVDSTNVPMTVVGAHFVKLYRE